MMLSGVAKRFTRWIMKRAEERSLEIMLRIVFISLIIVYDCCFGNIPTNFYNDNDWRELFAGVF